MFSKGYKNNKVKVIERHLKSPILQHCFQKEKVKKGEKNRESFLTFSQISADFPLFDELF